jgi:transcriptional regulator with XRE-family HTH domain
VQVCELVSKRIIELCRERAITPNGLSYLAGVSQSTIKSILGGESLNPGIVTLKKLCDGFEITLAEFFDTKEFNELEQELM